MHADKIVSTVKRQRLEIIEFFNDEPIDFLGCSKIYCEEKINYLISALKDLKKELKIK